MVLVAYSDSEGSDTESTPKSAVKAVSRPAQTSFAVDKANPKKIRVNLTETLPAVTEREDGEPAAKRPRVGGGAFSGFNAMLPAPKRDNLNTKPANGAKAPARKVFSLKTGAEPAFSRESDAEFRHLFTEQDQVVDGGGDTDTIPEAIPKAQATAQLSTNTTTAGKPFLFKPLSVSRKSKKKNPASQSIVSRTKPVDNHTTTQSILSSAPSKPPDPPERVNLFSAGPRELPEDPDEPLPDTFNDEDDEIIEVLDDDTSSYTAPPPAQPMNDSESLSSIANSLNLSAAERRQLLGRHGASSSAAASKIINFNTDVEYAANQALNAAGEQVQHNPVRAIAPGKHSLKQLLASAQGQKEALEESFASGRKNKKEAGSKYGW